MRGGVKGGFLLFSHHAADRALCRGACFVWANALIGARNECWGRAVICDAVWQAGPTSVWPTRCSCRAVCRQSTSPRWRSAVLPTSSASIPSKKLSHP